MNIKIGVSARHVHLSSTTYKLLFDEELTVKNMLNQPGEFASNQRLAIKTEEFVLENVRVIGPLRSYDQVELSKSDALKFGLNPPVRQSGDLDNTPGITLIGPKGEVVLDKGVIIAKRHIHFSAYEAHRLNIINNQPIVVKLKGFRGENKDTLEEQIIAFAKINDKSHLEMHIDTDEANGLGLCQDDECCIDYDWR